MDILKSTFINEAQELLQDLDMALLMLENNPTDGLGIEHVFRVMHTLKGNSKMFDFQKIAETVHDLESVYEDVRSGKRNVSKELLDCTFEALDHLKALLADSDCQKPANALKHLQLAERLRTMLLNQPDTQKGAKITTNRTFHIFFRPAIGFFMDGSNPLYILEDLSALGKTLMIPHFQRGGFKVTDCNTYWDIFLETDADIQTLRDVFVFATANSEVVIHDLPYTGLVASGRFAKEAKASKYADLPLEFDQIREWAEAYGDLVIKSTPEAAGTRVKEKVLSSVRVGSEKLEELMNLVSELITTQARLSLFAEQTAHLELENITEIFEKLSRRLRDVAFGMTLIPINNLFNRFQRMVRDISNDLGKEVKLISLGGETELDKNIIESLSDPLMHLIRNSVDHGIELPEKREQLGKPRAGKITLKAYYSGVFVYIEISDDGRGIDTVAVRKKAVEKGIIEPSADLTEQELLELIFHPGFSTAAAVTELSGRGVGMDVVHKTIQSLKGSISVESRPGEGSTITIKLPLTLSIIDGLLVGIGKDQYLLPLSVVEKCYEVQNTALHQNFHQLLNLDGVQYPYVNLREEFGQEVPKDGRSQAILVKHNETYVALITDVIVGEYQAVVKPLGKYFQGQDFVSGATILGDGSIALILDSYKIVDLYIQRIKLLQEAN